MKKEIERLKQILPTLNPASKDYTRVLDNLHALIWLARDITSSERETITVQSEPTPSAVSIPTDAVEKPKESKPEVKVSNALTKENVRAILSAASKSGTQIQPIIAKFVPEGKSVKFSEIPESCYEELVKEIKNAE